MKKLLLGLLFVIPAAHAEMYFVAKNAGGTDIVLTLERPTWCDGSALMYTSTTKSEVLYGCWFYMQDKIHVKFNDGDRRVYDVKNFELRGKE
jgi:hypothetical protein